MQDVSLAMIEDLWCEEAKPAALLLTVEADGLAEPIHVTDYPGGLDGKNYQGLVSSETEFRFVPFGFSWSGASQDSPATDAKLTIAGFDSQLEEAVDAATDAPSVTVQLVRPSDPDTVEMAINAARMVEAEIDGPTATGTIRPRDFSTEPATKNSYVPSEFPGLF